MKLQKLSSTNGRHGRCERVTNRSKLVCKQKLFLKKDVAWVFNTMEGFYTLIAYDAGDLTPLGLDLVFTLISV